MAFDAYFFNFQKKSNSTKAPTQAQYESGLDAKIVLLDSTSILAPTFKLELSTPPMANATKYNYCYVPDFHRFYFIDDWYTNRGLWYCDCKCDVLASYRSDILASTQYVKRSASSYDLTILDSVYPAKAIPNITNKYDATYSIYNQAANTFTDYCVVVNTLGAIDVAYGEVDTYIQKTEAGGNYYAMTLAGLGVFLDFLTTDFREYFPGTTELSADTAEMIYNPFDYIKSIRIYPYQKIFDPSLYPNQGLVPVKFGFWQTKKSDFFPTSGGEHYAYRIYNPVYNDSFYIPLGDHPQENARGRKMNGAPYSSYVLHYEPFGAIELDANMLCEALGVKVDIRVDLTTGACKSRLKPVTLAEQVNLSFDSIPNNEIWGGITQVGVETTIMKIVQNIDNNGLKESVFKGALAVGNKLAEKGMNIINTVAGKELFNIPSSALLDPIDAISAAISKCTYKGGGGTNLPMYYLTPYIDAFYTLLVDENIVDYGRPLYQRIVLSALSGFCLCDSAELTIEGLDIELRAICNYLNAGVFIE